MFYEICDGMGHRQAGFKHNPFHALVVPRPIGWVSTVSSEGVVNLAPFSFFNAVSSAPPALMYTVSGSHGEGGEKDSLRNVRETREFVFNLCTRDLARQMADSSTLAPRHIDEFEVTGLTKAPSRLVKPPRVAESPVHLECKVVSIMALDLGEGSNTKMIIGRVVAVHIHDDLIATDGRIDTAKVHPVSRLGNHDYTAVTETWEMLRPGWPLGAKPGPGGDG